MGNVFTKMIKFLKLLSDIVDPNYWASKISKKRIMQLVDVTLRDGGFTCDFDWPLEFAQEYYNLVSNLGVNCMELGYWKQTSKSKNRFFNLNMETVKQITGGQGKKNVCVMIDFHYCTKELKEYPTNNQNEIKMIRMTARKDMINDAFDFALKLKKHTGLEIAFNIFNTTNYTDIELNTVLEESYKELMESKNGKRKP